jgi:hypothetical protein
VISHGFQSVCEFCSHGVDADEYQTMIMHSGMVEQLDQEYG